MFQSEGIKYKKETLFSLHTQTHTNKIHSDAFNDCITSKNMHKSPDIFIKRITTVKHTLNISLNCEEPCLIYFVTNMQLVGQKILHPACHTLHNLPGTYSAAVCYCCQWGATEHTEAQDRGCGGHWGYKKLPAGDELQAGTIIQAIMLYLEAIFTLIFLFFIRYKTQE